MRTAVVVGGGISGIVSSLLLREKYERVVLIEKNTELGGLLRSTEVDGYAFDHGAHFLRDTGNVELDQVLFGRIRSSEEWLSLDRLKAGSFLNNTLNEKCQFVNALSLDSPTYHKGAVELLSSITDEKTPESLYEQLLSMHGETFTKSLFLPIVDKFFGVDASELTPNASCLFFPLRVRAFDPAVTRKLKKIAAYDHKLGFHSYDEGVSELSNYYPVEGGIGKWVQGLESELSEQGIEVVKGSAVASTEISGSRVERVVLNNNETIECDKVVWTLSPHLFLKSLSVEVEGLSKPQRLGSSIYNYVVDGSFATDLYFLTCQDPQYRSFRSTLYDNVQAENPADASRKNLAENSPIRITVEVLSGNKPEVADDHLNIFAEQLDMGLLRPGSKIRQYSCSHVAEGFPVPTTKFTSDSQRVLEVAKKQASNINFCGRSSGKAWFMNDVLLECKKLIDSFD